MIDVLAYFRKARRCQLKKMLAEMQQVGSATPECDRQIKEALDAIGQG